MTTQSKLQKATSSILPIQNPYGDISIADKIVPGLYTGTIPYVRSHQTLNDFREEVRQCRYFYRYDPISSTVVNRMAEMSVSDLRNRRKRCSDEEAFFFDAVAHKLTPILQTCALEFLLSGMAVPDYTTERIMGNRLDSRLGRTRYQFPNALWVRNPDNIRLKRIPASLDRSVFLEVPSDEVYFIQHNGLFQDGTADYKQYRLLEEQFPEYVTLIKSGQTLIHLDNARPILRKALTYSDYPQPFLVPALAALKHKLRIKQMDFSVATRALEAIRLIKAGSDEFPVTEGDDQLSDLEAKVAGSKAVANNEIVYSLITNHTVTVEWVYPPMDALLSDVKYNEPNAEIFLAMGFSRVLLVGEALRSNSSQSVASTLGPVSTLNELRRGLLSWVRELYRDLADKNSFKNIPEPLFRPIPLGDVAALAQFAVAASKLGILSKDTVAQYFGSDFESEDQQIDAEAKASGDDTLLNLTVQQPLEMQQEQQEHTQEMDKERFNEQKKQTRISNQQTQQQVKQQAKQKTPPKK